MAKIASINAHMYFQARAPAYKRLGINVDQNTPILKKTNKCFERRAIIWTRTKCI